MSGYCQQAIGVGFEGISEIFDVFVGHICWDVGAFECYTDVHFCIFVSIDSHYFQVYSNQYCQLKSFPKSKNNDDDQNEIHIFIAKGLWCFDLLNINCILPLLYDKLSQWHNVCDIIICLKPFTVPLCTSYFWSHFFEVLIEVEKFWSKLCVLLDGSRIIPHNTLSYARRRGFKIKISNTDGKYPQRTGELQILNHDWRQTTWVLRFWSEILKPHGPWKVNMCIHSLRTLLCDV